MMTWEQKLQAFNVLCECSLRMRRPGDWYITADIEVAGDGLLHGIYGNGETPEEAVQDHWRVLVTELKSGHYLAVNAGHENAKYVRWNGFMWEDASHLRNRAA